MDLLIATRNPGKVVEIRAILAEAPLTLKTLDAFPEIAEVDEDQPTLEGNAIKKAVSCALGSGLWAMADDSGLEVEALDGAPGVYSARYGGEPVDFARNNAKLLAELAGRPNRAARFRCVIALSSPEGQAEVVEGICNGMIGLELVGDGGFGYDPLFVPEGYDVTFAQMGADVKNGISHRGRALERAREAWWNGSRFGF